jgi:hypothetical protein
MELLGFQWTDFYDIWYLGIFRKYAKKIQVSIKSDKNNGHFTRRPCTFIITCWVLLRMRYISDRVIEKIKTHILCSITAFPKSCRWRDYVEKYFRAIQDTDDYIVWRMRIACWITKAMDTHLCCSVLVPFPRQPGLCERALVLRHT